MTGNTLHPFWINWDLYNDKSSAIHQEKYQLLRWLLELAKDGNKELLKAIEDSEFLDTKQSLSRKD